MADDKAGAAGGTGTDSAAATTTKTAGADGAAGAGAGNSADAGKGGDGTAGKSIIADGADKGNGADGKGKPDGTQAAPEKYEPFKMPEGFTVDEKATESFMAFAKAQGLTQEKAQAAVDMYATLQAQQNKEWQEQNAVETQKWYDASMKEIGKDTQAGMGLIVKAREGFFDNEAVSVMKAFGLDNHPAFVRAFLKIGRAIADDTVVDGGKGGGEKSAAEVLYPNQAGK